MLKFEYLTSFYPSLTKICISFKIELFILQIDGVNTSLLPLKLLFRKKATLVLSVFDHFVGLALKGLRRETLPAVTLSASIRQNGDKLKQFVEFGRQIV